MLHQGFHGMDKVHVHAGHEGYVVGGAVRDLLLRQRPKDFDIVTTATPLQVRHPVLRSGRKDPALPFTAAATEQWRGGWCHVLPQALWHCARNGQVKRLFVACRIIGKRFPIVHVSANGTLLEVSSFGTRADRSLIPPDAAAFLPNKHLLRKVCAWVAQRLGRDVSKRFGQVHVHAVRPCCSFAYLYAADGGDSFQPCTACKAACQQGCLTRLACLHACIHAYMHACICEMERDAKSGERGTRRQTCCAHAQAAQRDGGGADEAPGEGLAARLGLSWAAARAENALSRDFTVNAIMCARQRRSVTNLGAVPFVSGRETHARQCLRMACQGKIVHTANAHIPHQHLQPIQASAT
jgi:hypothetical protein